VSIQRRMSDPLIDKALKIRRLGAAAEWTDARVRVTPDAATAKSLGLRRVSPACVRNARIPLL
jgi:hypothetical protein